MQDWSPQSDPMRQWTDKHLDTTRDTNPLRETMNLGFASSAASVVDGLLHQVDNGVSRKDIQIAESMHDN